MRSRKSNVAASDRIHKLRRKLNDLDELQPQYAAKRAELLHDIRLAKHATGQSKAPAKRRQGSKSRSTKTKTAPAKSPNAAPTKRKNSTLSQLLSPKNMSESVKAIGNLRSTVKNWMQYLQQADQMLETIHSTSNSLKDSGVLDKLIKDKGRNLTTNDFTNILIALMNTPAGSQFFKSNKAEATTETNN